MCSTPKEELHVTNDTNFQSETEYNLRRNELLEEFTSDKFSSDVKSGFFKLVPEELDYFHAKFLRGNGVVTGCADGDCESRFFREDIYSDEEMFVYSETMKYLLSEKIRRRQVTDNGDGGMVVLLGNSEMMEEEREFGRMNSGLLTAAQHLDKKCPHPSTADEQRLFQDLLNRERVQNNEKMKPSISEYGSWGPSDWADRFECRARFDEEDWGNGELSSIRELLNMQIDGEESPLIRSEALLLTILAKHIRQDQVRHEVQSCYEKNILTQVKPQNISKYPKTAAEYFGPELAGRSHFDIIPRQKEDKGRLRDRYLDKVVRSGMWDDVENRDVLEKNVCLGCAATTHVFSVDSAETLHVGKGKGQGEEVGTYFMFGNLNLTSPFVRELLAKGDLMLGGKVWNGKHSEMIGYDHGFTVKSRPGRAVLMLNVNPLTGGGLCSSLHMGLEKDAKSSVNKRIFTAGFADVTPSASELDLMGLSQMFAKKRRLAWDSVWSISCLSNAKSKT